MTVAEPGEAVFERVSEALYNSWLPHGPEHMAKVVLLHPTDRDALAAMIRTRPMFWGYGFPAHKGDFSMETDFGDITVRADISAPPGTVIAMTEA